MRTALARQYRPRRFGEVAMQEHVAETLKTAVVRERVAHAYLFCGPRGVGKTTAARVLAMALNCPDRGDDGEPCGTCDSCARIWAGQTSLDVVEIDAASNRGVDDARDLRERAMYAPTAEQRYKVYIIDEAHMLTREAWNALLKILEEPPPRVIFVFATTEPQKIQQAAPPILSRCQRFDFRRISVASIVERLRHVLEAEGIDADDDALVPLARRAEGGLRDALSLLDQILAFADQQLTADDVRRVLGLVGEELYLELFGIVAERRYADVFRFVERVLDEGYDLAEFHRGLADALRTLLVVKLEGGEAATVEADLRQAFVDRAADFETGDLLRMLAQVAELDAEGRFRKSANPRILLEALLLRFAHLDRTVELEALMGAAADGAERGLDAAASATARNAHAGAMPGHTSRSAVADPLDRADDRREGTAGGDRPRADRLHASTGESTAGGDRPLAGRPQESTGESADRPLADPDVAGPHALVTDTGAPVNTEAAVNTGAAADTGPAGRTEAAAKTEAAARTGAATGAAAGVTDTGGAAVRRELADSTAEHGDPAVVHADPVLAAADTAFHAVLERGQEFALPRAVLTALRRSRITEADEGRIAVEVPNGVDRLIDDAAQRTALERSLSERLGRPVRLEVRATGAAAAPTRVTAEQVRNDRLARLIREEPVLGRAVREWDLVLL